MGFNSGFKGLIETIETPTHFDPCGVIMKENVHQMILYKTLNI